MKLPDITYKTGVQSLGRHDVSGPGRVARAEAASYMAIAGVAEHYGNVLAVTEYTKAAGKAKTEITDLYTEVTSKEAFTQDEIPDFVQVERFEKQLIDGEVQDVEREFIPASEIREQWFKQGLANISTAIVGNAKTTQARNRLKQDINGTVGPAAYAQLQAYNLAVLKSERIAEMDMSVQDAVVNGDRIGVEAILFRYRESGLISTADYEARQLKASQDLDIEAYSIAIMSTTRGESLGDSLGALENIQDNLAMNNSMTGLDASDMTAAQRNTLRATAENTRTHLKAERDEAYLAKEREGWDMYRTGALTANWIATMAADDQLNRAAAKSLLSLLDSDRNSPDINNAKVSSWKREIQKRLMYTEFGEQTSVVARSINRELMDQSDLNGEEAAKLFEYTDKVAADIRDNPVMKQALYAMKLTMGMPESDNVAVIQHMQQAGLLGDVTKMYEEFSNALFEYVDEFGAEANPMEFVRKNKDKYNVEDIKKAKQIRFEQSYPDLISSGPVKTSDPEVILTRLYKQYTTTGKSDASLEELIQEVYVFWYGTSLDIGNL